MPEANSGRSDTYSQRANVRQSQLPGRDLVDVNADNARAHDLSTLPSRPPSLLQRTLSVRAALLGACAAAAIACGLTYLRYAPPVAVRDEEQPARHRDTGAEQNLSAETAYMTPQALRQIDATLGMSKDKSDAVPPSDVKSTDAALSPAQVLIDKDLSVGESPTDNRSVVDPPAMAVVRPAPVTDTDFSQPQQRPTLSRDFSNIRDPEALERAIKEYGWTGNTGAATQRGSEN